MRNFLLILFIIGLAAISVTGCDRAQKPMMDAITTVETPTMDNPEAFAVAFVQEAVDLYKTKGREEALAYYNHPMSVSGQWYVFVIDPNENIVVQPILPVMIGRGLRTVVGSDGQALGEELATVTEEGGWIEYLWPDPMTGKLANKRTWAIRHDGHLFGTGYYEPWNPDPENLPVVSKDDPEAYAIALVHEAIARYEANGAEETIAYYNGPENIDGQWYVFITNPNDVMVVQPVRPDFVGRDIKDILDPDGFPIGAEIAAKGTGAGVWHDYVWPNPDTGKIEPKTTWAIRHDGYIFASGYYKSAADEMSQESN